MERTLVWLDRALEETSKGAKPGPKPGAKPDGFRTMLRLLRGQALDALGRREEAAKEYQKVEFLPPVGESREIARARDRKPIGRLHSIRPLPRVGLQRSTPLPEPGPTVS